MPFVILSEILRSLWLLLLSRFPDLFIHELIPFELFILRKSSQYAIMHTGMLLGGAAASWRPGHGHDDERTTTPARARWKSLCRFFTPKRCF